jgi:hypothetical protein
MKMLTFLSHNLLQFIPLTFMKVKDETLFHFLSGYTCEVLNCLGIFSHSWEITRTNYLTLTLIWFKKYMHFYIEA